MNMSWEWFIARWNSLLRGVWYLRVPVLVNIVVLPAFFYGSGQIPECLRSLIEDDPMHGAKVLLAVMVSSFVSWFLSCRYFWELELRHSTGLNMDKWAIVHLPCFVGCSPWLVVAFGFLLSSQASGMYFEIHIAWGVASFLMAVPAYLFFRNSRKFLKPKARKADDEKKGLLDYVLWWTPKLIVFMAMTVTVIFWQEPHTAARVGTINLVMFASGFWIVVGMTFVSLGEKLHIPFLGLFLCISVLIGLFSNITDNHEVRRVSAPPCEKHAHEPEIQDIGACFKDWLGTRPDLSDYDDANPYPVFVVAAEGGGIRAAYATAMALAQLHDESKKHKACGTFGEHIFAISGVSGGSVGAAVFGAYLSYEARMPKDKENPLVASETMDKVLGFDYLSPVVSSMLFPDFIQRFMPFPVPSFDRARALEEAIEWNWHKHTQGSEFGQAFRNITLTGNAKTFPLALFNTTDVGTGKKIVLSSIPLKEFSFAGHWSENVILTQGDEPSERLPLSTAAFMSARFPYITPPATFSFTYEDKQHQQQNQRSGKPVCQPAEIVHKARVRLADGGYYENSGCETIRDVLLALETYIDNQSMPCPFIICPIVISFQERMKSCSPHLPDALPTMGEIASPVRALLNARLARGERAYQDLATTVKQLKITGQRKSIVRLAYNAETRPLVLGWSLSKAASKDIEVQLRLQTTVHIPENDDYFTVLVKALGSKDQIGGEG